MHLNKEQNDIFIKWSPPLKIQKSKKKKMFEKDVLKKESSFVFY